MAFGIVAIASLVLTSLVAGISYYKAKPQVPLVDTAVENEEQKDKATTEQKCNNVHKALTWTNPVTGILNSVDLCCKGSNQGMPPLYNSRF